MSESPLDSDSPPAAPTALDDWLRSRLDHPVTIVLLSASESGVSASERALASTVAGHVEIRLRVERCPAPPIETAIERALLAVERRYPDVLLVEQSGTDVTFSRMVLRVADRLGLLDRAFVALIGPDVTRDGARRRGFEDGYTLDDPDILRILSREAVARDELRRHGSSPPCYL